MLNAHLLPSSRTDRPDPLLATALVAAVLVVLAGCSARPVEEPRGSARDGVVLDAAALHGDDGDLPPATTVLDDGYAGIARLSPRLLEALRLAARDAADDGIAFEVNSGWRSRAYQQRLFDTAVTTYGSREAAARWVAPPGTSPHVSGDAVDLAAPAARWVAQRGAAYGLCRIYRNEPWHVELRPRAADSGCPKRYADPSQDPRLQPR
jgi:hypothetical protein